MPVLGVPAVVLLGQFGQLDAARAAAHARLQHGRALHTRPKHHEPQQQADVRRQGRGAGERGAQADRGAELQRGDARLDEILRLRSHRGRQGGGALLLLLLGLLALPAPRPLGNALGGAVVHVHLPGLHGFGLGQLQLHAHSLERVCLDLQPALANRAGRVGPCAGQHLVCPNDLDIAVGVVAQPELIAAAQPGKIQTHTHIYRPCCPYTRTANTR